MVAIDAVVIETHGATELLGAAASSIITKLMAEINYAALRAVVLC